MKERKIKTAQVTKTSALDISRYLLSLDPERKYFTERYGNFRLNSLLHIMQILHYAKYGKMLFKEDMHAFPPKYQELSLEGQEKLSKIIFSKKIKDKEALIANLFKKENILY